MKVKKDKMPVIYKQDIMNEDGKLTVAGGLLVIGVIMAGLNLAFKILGENIVDKDKVN